MNWYKTAQADPNEEMWDAENGIGSTPNNMNIDYLGYKDYMLPEEFRKLVSPGVTSEQTKDFVIQAFKEGKKFGQPMLYKKWMEDDWGEKVWAITSHEGRSRSKAFEELFPGKKMEAHVVLQGVPRGAGSVDSDKLDAPVYSESEYNSVYVQKCDRHDELKEKDDEL